MRDSQPRREDGSRRNHDQQQDQSRIVDMMCPPPTVIADYEPKHQFSNSAPDSRHCAD